MTKYILPILAFIFLFSSCKEVVVELSEIPENTPPDAEIFITGNFNYWDPGDEDYQMQQTPDGRYFIELPSLFGKIEFKFTRGDWKTVEKDRCGYEISNRFFDYFSKDTLALKIWSWADLEPLQCDSISIFLKSVPKNTPDTAEIKIAGNFNDWNPGKKPLYSFKKHKNGKLFVKIPRTTYSDEKDLRFKIIKDQLSGIEVNPDGTPSPERIVRQDDTNRINLTVTNWKDLIKRDKDKQITIILTDIPEDTPPDSRLFLAGNFNNWNTFDIDYAFAKKENGNYSISLPKQKGKLEFKITRGTWFTEAANAAGERLDNFVFDYSSVDTIKLKIETWRDSYKRANHKTITVIIDSFPEIKGKDTVLFMASNYNNWKADSKNFRLKRNQEGKYYITLFWQESDLEYKITRGEWSNCEVSKNKMEIENRRIRKRIADTISISIERWKDL